MSRKSHAWEYLKNILETTNLMTARSRDDFDQLCERLAATDIYAVGRLLEYSLLASCGVRHLPNQQALQAIGEEVTRHESSYLGRAKTAGE